VQAGLGLLIKMASVKNDFLDSLMSRTCLQSTDFVQLNAAFMYCNNKKCLKLRNPEAKFGGPVTRKP
jgi:hypothetical protein